MTKKILLFTVFMGLYSFFYGKSGITISMAKICKGENVQLTSLATYIPPQTLIFGWFLDGVQIKDTKVAPQKTTTYELRTSLNGIASFDYAKVEVIEPPKITLLETLNVCEGNSIILSVLTKENVDYVSFRDQNAGTLYQENTVFTPTQSTTFEVSATSVACPSNPDIKTITITYLKKTDPSKLQIEPTISSLVCESCELNLNDFLRKNLKHTGDSINAYTISWLNESNPEAIRIPQTPYQSVVYEASINAILYTKNQCDASSKSFVNYPVHIAIEIRACLPFLVTVIEPVYTCDSLNITLQNPNLEECKFTEKEVEMSASKGNPLKFVNKVIGNNAQYFHYTTLVEQNTSYTASVNYELTCSQLTTEQQIKLQRQVETEPYSLWPIYHYCTGDTAYFQINRKLPRQQLKNVEILGEHAQKFRLFEHSATTFTFASTDTVMDIRPYSPLSYKYTYYDTNCKTTYTVQDKIDLFLDNCQPSTLLTYPPHTAAQNRACKGDTIQFSVGEYARTVHINRIVFQPNPAYSIRFIKKEEDQCNLYSMQYFYELYAYQSFYLKGVIYFSEAGVDTNLAFSQFITISSCEASLGPLLGEDNCPGSNIEAHLILQNPTSHLSKPLKDAIQWHNDPPVQMEYVRSDTLPPYQYFYYRTKIPTQQKVNFKVRICYNEGDSLYEKEYSRLSRTPACDPYLYASDYELCKGEEFSLFVMGNNPNDSIFSVQWDSIPHCAIDLINSKFKNQFEFTTKAYKDTTYRVRIRALNNDSIREYVDSISSVKVRAQPHSFTTDKVSICRGTQIDLKNYENRPPNEGGVNRILYPGNNSIFSRHNSASVIVQAESYYLCKWMHGNKVYWDSIFVQVDTTLWATAMPDTTVCQYAKVQLIGNSNGVLTWVKNGSVLYEKIPVDSVVYDIIEADAEYKLVFENACEKDTTHLHIYIRPAPLLQIIPYTEICIHDSISLNIDNHTCLPNSLYWTYTHDSLLGEQKIASAQVKNIPLNYSDTTYFYAHGIGYNACPMQSLCKVMVYPLPKVQLQVDGDSVLCAKGNTSLVLCASGAQSYYFPQFNCSSCTKYRTSVDTTTIFSVEGTDEHGCVNEGRFHFIVKENVLKLEDTGFCERQAFCLLADSVANASYRWIDPRGKVISDRICMCLSQLSKQDEGIYQLLLHQFSCTDTNKVRLYHKPTPYARIDKQNAPLCEGLSLSLAASSNQIKSQNYWILNDSSMVSQKKYTKTSVQVRDSGSYCFVSNLNHCADTSCVFVRVDTRTKPDFISSNLYYCEGDSVQLMASPIHDSIRYTWKTKNRNLIMLNNIASIPDIQLSENGSLCLQVQKYTCIDTICKPLQVRMRPNPSIVGNSFYCEFENVVISAQDTLAGAFSQWKYQGKPFKNAVKFEYPYIQCSDSGLYIFTQIFNACESRPDSFYLQVRPLPLINLGSTDYVCEGNHLLLDVERVGGSYLWSTGSIEPHIWVRDSALYWVDVVENQCHFRDSLYIYLRPTPFVHLGNDSILCKGDVLTLHGPNEAETFLWQDQSISNEFQVHQEGLYWLQATLNACSHRDSIQFVYKYCGRFFLPNAFTPNGDNLNDGYKVVLSAQKEEIDFTMWIYDKNGKLMFTTTNFDQAWDGSYHGKLCAAGIYICKVKIVDKIDKNIYTKTISVNLIR